MHSRPVVAGLAAGAVVALASGMVAVATPAVASPGLGTDRGRLDVLFVGAHPDDEAGGLSTYGQWNEYGDVRTGVITVTRGEGGGNAVGPEEGPPLGLLREAEERRAVGRAGITNVHNLDDVDFFYTVSDPLTAQVWDRQDALSKVVRIIRETRPTVIVTMNPAPSPGNHGNHQEAGRLAIQAFYAAGDPSAFPDQIRREGLPAWQPGRLFTSGAPGSGPAGPNCASAFTPADPTANVYGIWSGRPSARNGGKSWAQVEREGQREYASQGWAVFPDVSTDPNALGCDRFTQVDSRVPFTVGNTSPDGMLEGALRPAQGGLPLGTQFWLSTSTFEVTGGGAFTVTANARAAAGSSLKGTKVTLSAPAGWQVQGSGTLGTVGSSRVASTTFTVTPEAGAVVGSRARLSAQLQSASGTGGTSRAVKVAAAVRATPQLLPQVTDFEQWAAQVGVPHLSGTVLPVHSLPSGGHRGVRVDLANTSTASQSGTVALALPAGFAADAAQKPYGPLAAGATGSVTFEVTNTDASLPTSNQGGSNGDYAYTVTATNTLGQPDTKPAALELVPTTTVPQAPAPTVDGVESPGEYPGTALDLSRRWEGENCASAADCSGSAKVVWSGDALYMVVHATDDTLGTVLDAADCKRHWRTDSVEIALDPRGTSENTSTTFKTGIFPTTTGGDPCHQRDADNRQGPGGQTAPGMQVASTVTQPYTGYTVEVKIDLADLPAAVDPQRMGLNVFIYDSDTQDKTGQTRIGWSTWGGVQGDPYRWGQASLPGYTPPAGRPTEPVDPQIPQDVARSVNSPQSILQSARTGVPLAGGPAAPVWDTALLAGRAGQSGVTVRGTVLATGRGTAHLFVWDPASGVRGSAEVALPRAGLRQVSVPVEGTVGAGTVLLLAFESAAGGTQTSSIPVR